MTAEGAVTQSDASWLKEPGQPLAAARSPPRDSRPKETARTVTGTGTFPGLSADGSRAVPCIAARALWWVTQLGRQKGLPFAPVEKVPARSGLPKVLPAGAAGETRAPCQVSPTIFSPKCYRKVTPLVQERRLLLLPPVGARPGLLDPGAHAAARTGANLRPPPTCMDKAH